MKPTLTSSQLTPGQARIARLEGEALVTRIWIVVALMGLLCLAAVASAGAQLADEYRLGSDDVIQVQVWGRTDLGGRFTVDPKGEIVLPLIGKVTATGLTVAELGTILTARYSILFPAVTEVLVFVEGYFSRKISVLGEVGTPGQYAFVEIPPIRDILIKAGGTTPAADLRRVEIVRKTPGPGEERSVTVNLSKGTEGSPQDSLPTLRPEDTIIVRARGEVGQPDEEVQLLGAVRSPGFYSIDIAGRVSTALGASGGALDNANLKHVRILRRTDDGVLVFDLNFDEYLQRGSPDVDYRLQAGDVVNVPARSGLSVNQLLPFVTVLISLAYLGVALDN